MRLSELTSYYHHRIFEDHVNGDVTALLNAMLAVNFAYGYTNAERTRRQNILDLQKRARLATADPQECNGCELIGLGLGGREHWRIRHKEGRTWSPSVPLMGYDRMEDKRKGRVRRIDQWLSVSPTLAEILDARRLPLVINATGSYFGCEQTNAGQPIPALRELARYLAIRECVTGEASMDLSGVAALRRLFDDQQFTRMQALKIVADRGRGALEPPDDLEPFDCWSFHCTDDDYHDEFPSGLAYVCDGNGYRLWYVRDETARRRFSVQLALTGNEEVFIPFEEIELPDEATCLYPA